MIPVTEVIFYICAAALVVSAFCVILNRNPVQSALSLVVCFLAAAVLWMLLQAEFLSLVLIFVYVGAVMTLFLFVVMMLNITQVEKDKQFSRVLPLGVFLLLVLFACFVYTLTGKDLAPFLHHLPSFPSGTNNTVNLGMMLYTNYLLPLEITAVVLLVAMLAAIAIAFRGPRPNAKTQIVSKQLDANKADRLKIIPMKSEKK
jgi:NADH-quinone oxidoreductase subunit J